MIYVFFVTLIGLLMYLICIYAYNFVSKHRNYEVNEDKKTVIEKKTELPQ